MAGEVVNIKVCSPLKLRSVLTGNYHAICHYSYNLPLAFIVKRPDSRQKYKGIFAAKRQRKKETPPTFRHIWLPQHTGDRFAAKRAFIFPTHHC